MNPLHTHFCFISAPQNEHASPPPPEIAAARRRLRAISAFLIPAS
jgi:hypothetical protein